MAAVVLPQQPGILELLGNMLNAAGNIPKQYQAGQQAAQQQANMQQFQQLIGQALSQPSVVPGAGEPVIDPDAEITEVPEGSLGGFAPTGMAGPTMPNPARAETLKTLKDVGPYFGVPKQGLTLEEAIALQNVKGATAEKVADIKGKSAETVAGKRSEGAAKVAEINAKGKESSNTERARHNKAMEGIFGQNALTGSRRADTYKDAVEAQAAHAIQQTDAYKQRTEMMSDALGAKDTKVKVGVLGQMSKQLTQINKIKSMDLTLKENQALLQQATGHYEQLRQTLIDLDPDAEQQVPTLNFESERGSIGIMDMLKNAWSAVSPYGGTAPASGITSTPATPAAPGAPATTPAPRPAATPRPAAATTPPKANAKTEANAPVGTTVEIGGVLYKKMGPNKWDAITPGK